MNKFETYTDLCNVLYYLVTFDDFPKMYDDETKATASEELENLYSSLMVTLLMSKGDKNDIIEALQNKINIYLDYYNDSIETIKKLYMKEDKAKAVYNSNVSRMCYIMLLVAFGKLEALRV